VEGFERPRDMPPLRLHPPLTIAHSSPSAGEHTGFDDVKRFQRPQTTLFTSAHFLSCVAQPRAARENRELVGSPGA